MKFEKTQSAPFNENASTKNVEVPTQHTEVLSFIKDSYKLKPEGLYMDELKWKYLIRSSVRGKNIMMIGPSGCGKTVAAQAVQKALGRPTFYFNLGATQDPRSSLIGNVHFIEGEGTVFAEALFVKAIRTPNAIILLDELTRAHPDAWNILMTVLDYKQRYLRIDEKDNCETVMVADGVTFIATANIGNEYTATRQLDRALQDRFTIIEVPVLDAVQELSLLQYIYPEVSKDLLEKIAAIAAETRNEVRTDSPKISTMMSTRMSVEMAGLLYDGFSFLDAAQVAVFPFFTVEGGNDSERSFIQKVVQQYNVVDDVDGADDGDLFSSDDIKTAFSS